MYIAGVQATNAAALKQGEKTRSLNCPSTKNIKMTVKTQSHAIETQLFILPLGVNHQNVKMGGGHLPTFRMCKLMPCPVSQACAPSSDAEGSRHHSRAGADLLQPAPTRPGGASDADGPSNLYARTSSSFQRLHTTVRYVNKGS